MFLRSLAPLAVEKKLKLVALGTLDDAVKEWGEFCRITHEPYN
jgi:hypothetical protein